MISKQGRTLNGVGLTQGNINRTDGVFPGATTFYCVDDGGLKFTFNDGTFEEILFTKGQSFPVNCKSIEISDGTFHIGFD